MSKWLAVLLNVSIMTGVGYGTTYLPTEFHDAVKVVALAAGAYATKKTSETNPDGTPAQVAYVKPEK